MLLRIVNRIRSLPVRPLCIFFVLSLAILFPLLGRGYVLTLDMSFAPGSQLVDSTRSSYLFYFVIDLLGNLIPLDIIQKVILLSIFSVSGYGMYQFVQTFRQAIDDRISPKDWDAGAYFAGILYIFNPFVYSRFMAGQFAVLLGYALMPIFIRSFLLLYVRPDVRSVLRVIAWLLMISIVSIHMFVIALIPVSILSVAMLSSRRITKGYIRQLSVYLAIITLVFGGLSSYWLLPALSGSGVLVEAITNFGVGDQLAFATNNLHLGIIGNLLAMQGFWADTKNLYLTASDVAAWWLLPITALWLAVLAGIIFLLRSPKKITIIIILSTLSIALILASGVVGPFAVINRWLYSTIPFFAGYRESQKFVGLIVLCYAVLGAVAVSSVYVWLKTRVSQQWSELLIGSLFVLPILSAPLMLWGFHGQLKTALYPKDWYEVRDTLNADCRGECRVLSLPWHYYMRYDFAGRVIATPVPQFFGNYILSSDNPELQGAASYSSSTDRALVEKVVLPYLASQDLDGLRVMAKMHIHYILVAKENDYKRYDYLNGYPNIRKVKETQNMQLYEVYHDKEDSIAE